MSVVLNHDLFYIIYNNRKVSFRNVGGWGGIFLLFVCFFGVGRCFQLYSKGT